MFTLLQKKINPADKANKNLPMIKKQKEHKFASLTQDEIRRKKV